MTFEEFYQEVIRQAGVEDTVEVKNYVRILWDNAYAIHQAVHSVKTMNDDY